MHEYFFLAVNMSIVMAISPAVTSRFCFLLSDAHLCRYPVKVNHLIYTYVLLAADCIFFTFTYRPPIRFVCRYILNGLIARAFVRRRKTEVNRCIEDYLMYVRDH